jgi:secreted Zn-dependent insulinase-like peptidase
MRRLKLLTPERAITKFVSKAVEKEADLRYEKWYGTPFKSEKIDDAVIANLSKIIPTSEDIGYPPENDFIPKTLIEKKQERPQD